MTLHLRPVVRRCLTAGALAMALSLGWGLWPAGAAAERPARDSSPPAEPALGADAGADVPPPSLSKPADTDEQLARVLAEVDLQNVPLEVAFDRLRDAARANIVVQWHALEAAGVRRDGRVRLRLWDVTLARALGVLLKVATDDAADVGYAGDDGVITVTTKDHLHGYLPTKAYDIRDLVRRMEQSDEEFRGAVAVGQEAGKTTDEYVDEVSTYLRDMIDSDSWRDNGGSVGALRYSAGRLWITQTPANHRRIEEVLDEMRTEFAKPMRPATTRPAGAGSRPTAKGGQP